MGKLENQLAAAKTHKAQRVGRFTMKGVCPKKKEGNDFTFDLSPETKTKGECPYCQTEIKVESWPDASKRIAKEEAKLAEARAAKKAKADKERIAKKQASKKTEESDKSPPTE